jgi:GNAT superfamily N-acetyltransferase
VRISPLRAQDLSRFSCGKKPLDSWLQQHASGNDARDLSRTFVLLDDANEVVGYYPLTTGGVLPQRLPEGYADGPPAYERGMVLLARLAIAESAQGFGYGRDLIFDALARAAESSDIAASQFVAVDPIDAEARSFYAKFGFRDIGEDEGERMFLRMDDVRDALSERDAN